MAPPGYVPIAVPVAKPSSVSTWAIVLTGAYAVITLVSAALTPATVEELKKTLEDPESASPFAGQNPVSLISGPVSIASYVLLALWMWRIRGSRKARGETIGGPPAVEWWGWFVPLAHVVLPVLAMRVLTKGRASMGLLAGWWSTFVVSVVLGIIPGISTWMDIDWSTGKIVHPEVLDSMTPYAWASGVALLVSWVFLALIIQVTTRREQELS